MLFLLLFYNCLASAQISADPDLAPIVAHLEANNDDTRALEELLDRLSQYKNRPLNINKATEVELKELGLLDPLQIRSLRTHLQQNGPLLEVFELQSVEHFELSTIQLLLPFISIGAKNSLDGMNLAALRSGKNDFLLRCQQKLLQDTAVSYLGSPQQVLLRYRYRFGDAIAFSLQAEKDAGEPFFRRQKVGFDFVSANLELKQIGFVKKIVIGDYNLQFGQGLSLWSGLGFGKSSLISSIAKQEVGLKPYTSVYEGLFFRGVAAQLGVNSLSVTPFYSYRKLDAALNDPQGIKGIHTAGLHRTENELANKHSLGQQVFGTSMQWNLPSLQVGLTAYHTQFTRPFLKENHWYNQFDFYGKSLNNASIYGHYTYGNAYYFGELAHSFSGKPAAVIGLLSSLSPKLSLGLLWRSYPATFHSFYNAALAESSSSLNEKGFYSGLHYKFSPKWEWSLYADVFRFPWLSFGLNTPADGTELLQQITYKPTKQSQLQVLYQRTQKYQTDTSAVAIPFTSAYVHQKIRLDFRYPITTKIRMHHRAEMIRVAREKGYLFLHDIDYQPLQSKWSGNLRLAIFNVSNYDARVYAFQQDVLFAYTIDAYQKKGLQFYINTRYNVRKGVDVWLRYESKRYIQSNTLVATAEPRIREIKAQVRYQF